MHWIQRHILKQLAFSDNLRYSALIPDGVEGNLFQYHARSLEKSGLIIRSGDGYRLSQYGQNFVADLSQTKLMNPRRLSRPIIMIATKNDSKEYGLFRWRRHPYRDLVSLPFGRQIAGHPPTEMALIQLSAKTGYEADLQFVGLVDVINRQKASLDHLSCIVFSGTNLRQVTTPDGLTGEFFWDNPSNITAHEAVSGFHQVTAWLETDDRPPLLEIQLSPKS